MRADKLFLIYASLFTHQASGTNKKARGVWTCSEIEHLREGFPIFDFALVVFSASPFVVILSQVI